MVQRGLMGLSACVGAVICALVVTSPGLARVVSVSHALQVKFEAIDVPVEKASSKWTSAVSGLPSSASSASLDATLSKVSPAYDAALKTFDGALVGLHLPGPAGTDASAIVTEDKAFENLLGAAAHVSTSQFETTFRAIFSKDLALASQFKAAMGLQADSSMVI